MKLAAISSCLPAQSLNPETPHLAIFQEEQVKISTKSVANLILNSLAMLLNPSIL